MSRVQQGHTCRKNDEVDGYSVPNDFPFAEDALLEHVQRWRAKTPTDSLQWRIGASPVRFPPQRGTGEGAYPPRDNYADRWQLAHATVHSRCTTRAQWRR